MAHQTARWSWIMMLLLTYSSYAQMTVSGRVTDNETEEGLPGVTVLVKGSSTGTVTDIEGNYRFSVPEANATLVFSFVGFAPQEVEINGRQIVDVALSADIQALNEVVVVGYGTMERANVTGAISTVDVQEITKASVPNVVEAMRGQVAGLQIVRTGGQPGSGVTFKIRGNNSLGASASGGSNIDDVNQPIIVIDGVPLVGGNLAELNPADIESINVLKDAASASIYGSSGANGVILITTKNGRPGRTQIKASASTGIVNIAQRPNIMNGDEFLQFKFDAFKAGDATVPDPTVTSLLDMVEEQNYIAGNEVNWLDEVLRTGIQNNMGVEVSGGSAQGNFYLSGNYYGEKGPIEASDYKRFSTRFNANWNINDRITVGANVQLSKSFSDQRTRIVGFENNAVPSLSALVGTSPFGNLYDAEGNYSKFATEDLFAVNPLHKFNESEFDVNVTRAYINPNINIEIIDGLTYTLNTFAQTRMEFFGRYQSDNFTDDALNLAQVRESEEVNYLLDNILNYTREFGDHGVNATVIYGGQVNKWTRFEMNARNIAADELGYYGIHSAPAAQQTIGTNTSDWAKYYVATRLGYNYQGKYSATFTVRRDASSRFLGDNRYGIFPSASLAWNAQEESWWFGGNNFNMFKMRLSYGVMGNDNINPFSYQAGTYPTSIPGTENTGFRPGTTAGNKNLKWETSKQFNVGADFGLLASRITGSIEVYNTATKDVLLYQQIPAPLNNGYSQFPSNIGETANKGIELSLKAVAMESNDFSWTPSLNLAANRSTIEKLNETGPDGEPLDDISNGWFIGQDFREIYDFKYLGVWQADEVADATVTTFGNAPQAGDAKIDDVNGDGNIDFDDRTFIGNPTPSWYGGINNVITYKGFTLSVLFEAVMGVKRYNSIYGGYNSARGNTIAINYWTPDNPSNDYPRVGEGSPMSGPFGAAIFTEDASFVSLRNISFSYNLPSKWVKKASLGGVTLSIRGNNLKYWTDYTNAYSPEITNTDQYPVTKNWTAGLNVTF